MLAMNGDNDDQRGLESVGRDGDADTEVSQLNYENLKTLESSFEVRPEEGTSETGFDVRLKDSKQTMRSLRIFIIFTSLVRYVMIGWTVYYFTPYFAFLLPFSFGLTLNLLTGWFDDGTATGDCRLLQASITIATLYDLSILCFMFSLGLRAIYSLLSEPSGGLNSYLGWVYWVALSFTLITTLSLCVQAFVLQRLCLSSKRCCTVSPPPLHSAALNSTAENSVDNGGNYFGLVGEEEFAEGFTPPVQRRRARALLPIICLGILMAFVAIIFVWGIQDVISISVMEPAPPIQNQPSEGCDPLVNEACILPYPSDLYMVDDPTTFTGHRIQYSKEAFPTTRLGKVDPYRFNMMDGYSTSAPALFSFNENVSISNLIPWNNIGAYLLDNATTVLLNSETGEKVAHFVDRDAFDLNFGHPRLEPDLLILQPGHILEFNTTYIIGVRNLISEGSGDFVQPSPAFKALRDHQSFGSVLEDLGLPEQRVRKYNEFVFPKLKLAGFQREELQLAFYFTTTSREESLGRFEYMRDKTMEEMDPLGPSKFEIIRVDSNSCPSDEPISNHTSSHIAKVIHGYFMTTNWLLHPGPGPKSFMTMTVGDTSPSVGIKGMPFKNGLAKVNFMIQIPCSLYKSQKPASMILQYGHGLFGSRRESEDHYLQALADRYGWIIVATDWTGMAKYDVLSALRMFMGRIDEFAAMPERTQQGFLNKALMIRLIRGHLAAHVDFQIPGKSQSFVSNTTKISYYGNSQGSVVGGGYFGSSKELSRATLGVPGCPFALVLTRSKDFAPYHMFLKFQLFNQRDARIYISIIQQLWDPGESAGWMHSTRDNNWNGYPKKHVLLQAAIGDAQVSVVSGEFMARSFKCNTIHPQYAPVYGIPERVAPFSGNGFVEWKYDDVPPTPFMDTPPLRGDTHECPRRERRGQDQMHDFFMQEEVTQHCAGVCESKTCPRGNSDN